MKIRYANTYSEANGVSFKVEIKKGENVEKEYTITKANDEVTQGTLYTETIENINVLPTSARLTTLVTKTVYLLVNSAGATIAPLPNPLTHTKQFVAVWNPVVTTPYVLKITLLPLGEQVSGDSSIAMQQEQKFSLRKKKLR